MSAQVDELPKIPEHCPITGTPIPIPTELPQLVSDWQKTNFMGAYITQVETILGEPGSPMKEIRMRVPLLSIDRNGANQRTRAALEISARKWFGESFVQSEAFQAMLREAL